MAFILQENIPLKDHCTFRMGGHARYFCTIAKPADFKELSEVSKQQGLDIFILGKGSNCIFTDGTINRIVGFVAIEGLEVIDEGADSVLIKIGAGELWDDVVAWTVKNGWSGIEALSAIPGTSGATPVQNVGAYGQEIKDTLQEVSAYDRKCGSFVILSNKECNFAYRTSIFNTTEKGRYLIASIALKLLKHAPVVPDYPGVKNYVSNTTLEGIRNAITDIRWSKLPKPNEFPNVGSFFKNALVEKELADELKRKYPEVIIFEQPDGRVKIPSGWLIEQSGLKGKSFGHFRLYEKNALVLIHDGEGSYDELLKAKEEIINAVREKFGLTLEQEPEVIK